MKKSIKKPSHEDNQSKTIHLLIYINYLNKGTSQIIESVKKTNLSDKLKLVLGLGSKLADSEKSKIKEDLKLIDNKNYLSWIDENIEVNSTNFLQKIAEIPEEDVIVLLEPDKLNTSLPLSQILANNESLKENEIELYAFQHSGTLFKTKRVKEIIALHPKMAVYVLHNSSTSEGFCVPEIIKQCQKLDLKIIEKYIDTENPFIRKKDKYSKTKFFIHWFFRIPVQELRNRPVIPAPAKNNSLYRLIFIGVAILSLLLLMYFSKDAGMSGDEYVDYKHAGYVMNYYTSFGNDTTCLNTPKTKLQYYGQSLSNFTAVVNNIFNIDNEYESRHMQGAIIGWLTMLFTALFATLILGWRAGLITFLLILFSPRILGHSWNNLKDIPFAMTYIFTIYHIGRFIKHFPRPSFNIYAMIALGIALSISVRIGGLLIIAYLFMFFGLYSLIYFTHKKWFKDKILQLNISVGFILIIVTIVGYLLGLVYWPYGFQNPIKNPIESLKLMTHFSTSLRQTFNGDVIWSDFAPWNYVPKYLLISIPLVVFAGVLLFLLLGWTHKQSKAKNFLYFIAIWSFLFPIVYIIYKESNVYGGWRHVLFAYPTLVVLAGSGFELAYRFFKKNVVHLIITLLLVFLLYHPVKHTFKNHPYQYVYFNQLVGGTDGAYGKFETDYYYHSLREGSKWLRDSCILKENPYADRKIIVATNHGSIVSYYFRKYTDRVKIIYVRYYQRGEKDWDYAIIANSYINPEQLKKKIFPPKGTIHTVKVDNSLICAVIERKDKNDFLGVNFLRQGQIAPAIEHLKAAIAYDPHNETALLNLTNAYLSIGDYDNAIATGHKLNKVYPDYDQGLRLLGLSYLSKNELNNALGVFNRLSYANPKYYPAFYYLGYIYAQQNQFQIALNYLEKAININRRYKEAYILMGRIYQSLGKQKEAEYYMRIASSL